MWKIPLFDLAYDSREQEAVNRVLSSRWLSSGAETLAFEQAFADYLGGDIHCIAVANCTCALQMALQLHAIGPGDEVIIPALTFVADLNTVQLTGATPVLADCVSLADWNLSADTIGTCISPKTKAVLVVHYAGMPCDMQPIIELCDKNNIVLIEDCAHAPGATYYGQHCGTFGTVACYSFFANKNLSMGEGGLFVTRDQDLAAKARLFRSHGMTSMTVDRHAGKDFSYDVVMPGVNARTDEIHAALGRVQLEKLDHHNRLRAQHHANYVETLATRDEMSIPFQSVNPDFKSSYHIFPILLRTAQIRPAFMQALKAKGIQTSIHYPAMDHFAFYKNRIKTPPIAADIASRTVTLPLYPGMQDDDVASVCEVVMQFFENNSS